MREALVDRDGGKVDRESPGQHHAALDRLDELRRVAVARVVAGRCIGDAHHRAREGVVGGSRALDEGPAEEEREIAVAVAREPLLEALVLLVVHGRVNHTRSRRGVKKSFRWLAYTSVPTLGEPPWQAHRRTFPRRSSPATGSARKSPPPRSRCWMRSAHQSSGRPMWPGWRGCRLPATRCRRRRWRASARRALLLRV